MNIVEIDVGKDFSRYPAGRFSADGPFSGEKFRNDFLLPKLMGGISIRLYLDNTAGYGSSFLEEAFGGLIRSGISRNDALSLISFITDDFALKEEIAGYINDEADRRLK